MVMGFEVRLRHGVERRPLPLADMLAVKAGGLSKGCEGCGSRRRPYGGQEQGGNPGVPCAGVASACSG